MLDAKKDRRDRDQHTARRNETPTGIAAYRDSCQNPAGAAK